MDSKSENRIVFSQYSRDRLGLYMATNRQWKYIYSAADNKEWLFDIVSDPFELQNCIGDAGCRHQAEYLKQACLHRLREDGFTEAIDGNDWRRFPAQENLRAGSDEGMIFQDPLDLDVQLRQLKQYESSNEFKKSEQFQLFERIVSASQPD